MLTLTGGMESTHGPSPNDQEQTPYESEPGFTEHTSFHSNVSEISNPSDYKPLGVTHIISQGHSLIGVLSDNQVLKYPSDPNNKEYQEVIRKEAAILHRIGAHPRIVGFLGLNKFGIRLRYYPQGSLRRYLKYHPHVRISKKLDWCEQLASAVGLVHSKNVIHCDICLHNVLLNDNLEVLLADFQGILLSCDNTVALDGLTRECPKSYMPREDIHHASVKTDLFALGSAIYHFINGHEVFPELRNLHDGEEILHRFMDGTYPGSDYVASSVVEKCWKGEYTDAKEVSIDLAELQQAARQADSENLKRDCTGQW
ncbi:unnamed protein product [Penicillium salamii]|uniref:EKC/KEOPS complex subunit BUD32 n=1 Tax=Penicillium salamii TaxID=1612424 RepID=A0A9W4IJ79_9EURO|nr:unnamed protein product [Penicillium salamii]